jgi:hypothetical protein
MMTILLTALLIAQTPARDVVGPPRPGTGVITGLVVIDDVDPKPLRRVTVTLSSGTIDLPRAAITDDTGRFTFTGLPAANYTLTAARPTFVTAYYGAKKPGRGPGVPIAVAAGQRISDITLTMVRGAVVTGIVRLPSGKALTEANVMARRVTMVNGQRQFEYGPTVTTDERGEYRMYGLAPGDYVVQVTPPYNSNGNDMRRMTAAEITAAQALARTPASSTAMPPPPPPGPSVNFAPVFYPGTADSGAALVLTLTPGQERGGVDMTLQFVQTAQITGTVMGPDGRPPLTARFTLATANRTVPTDPYSGSGGSVVMRPDGSFLGTGLSPGHYTLVARGAPAVAPGAPPNAGRGGSNPLPLWGFAEFDINGRDLSGLMIQLQPGMTVAGKVVFEPPVAGAVVPEMTRVRLGIIAAVELGAAPQNANPLAAAGSSQVPVEQDGRFTIGGVAPGMYRFNVQSVGAAGGFAPPGGPTWSVKSITFKGRDVADLPFEIKPGEDVGDVVVSFSDLTTEISGTVFDELNRPTPGFPIVVFSTNRGYWPAGQTRVRKVQPASDGKFKIASLPPGEYYVCAVTDSEISLTDPVLLESLAAASFKITLAAGEKKVQDLKLGGK